MPGGDNIKESIMKYTKREFEKLLKDKLTS